MSISTEQINHARQVFGVVFKELRTEKKLTQKELAQLVGVTEQTIIKIEKGKFNYGVDILFNLSYYLGFTIEFNKKEEASLDRFILQDGKEAGTCTITDTLNKIVCTYKKGKFNETQKFTFLEDAEINPSKLSTIMREFGDFYNSIP